MKTTMLKFSALTLATVALTLAGCNRQTRGNADAHEQSRAAGAPEGTASTAGSAGEAKNFGDTRAKQQQDGVSPSASPTGLSKDAKPGDAGGAISPPEAKASTAK